MGIRNSEWGIPLQAMQSCILGTTNRVTVIFERNRKVTAIVKCKHHINEDWHLFFQIN